MVAPSGKTCVCVQLLGDLAVGELSGGVPLEAELDGNGLDGMDDQTLVRGQVALTGVGAVAGAVGHVASGAPSVAIAEGDTAVVKPLAGAAELALAGLLAQVVERSWPGCRGRRG